MNSQPYLSFSLDLDRSANGTTTLQIVEALAAEIGGNGNAAGYRLPPVRRLALQLGVSKNTIQVAYDELVARGLVESRSRVGLFVVDSSGGSGERVPEAEAFGPELLAWDGLAEVECDRGLTDLSNVFLDRNILPMERLTSAFRSISCEARFPEMYSLQGYKPLREKIAERLRYRGMDAEADHIVITAGSQMALDLAFRGLKRKVVAVESPAYYTQKLALVQGEFEVVKLPVDPFNGLDLDLWEAQIKKYRPSLLSVVPNFQNPTGYSYTTSERETILKWSAEYGFGILEDDWGSDMMSYSEFSPSFRSRGGTNVLYVNSFTKKLMPSLRIGYVLGNEKTVQSLARIKAYTSLGVPTLAEMGLFEFLDKGYYDAHLKSIQGIVDERYRSCLELLENLMPEGVKWTRPGGGPALWLNLPESIDLEKLSRGMKEEGYLIRTVEGADAKESHLHGFRLGYAWGSTETLERALERLGREIVNLK
ncbi:MAG: PLP-dependent aminotransferase family protein [Verrucomicrobiota bacterium]